MLIGFIANSLPCISHRHPAYARLRLRPEDKKRTNYGFKDTIAGTTKSEGDLGALDAAVLWCLRGTDTGYASRSVL